MVGVPQGSILWDHYCLTFFLENLFFIVDDMNIASYADDNTPHIVANTVDDIIESLEQASDKLFDWFKQNLYKNNADKCHNIYILVQMAK